MYEVRVQFGHRDPLSNTAPSSMQVSLEVYDEGERVEEPDFTELVSTASLLLSIYMMHAAQGDTE